jgi:hypothetical protein
LVKVKILKRDTVLELHVFLDGGSILIMGRRRERRLSVGAYFFARVFHVKSMYSEFDLVSHYLLISVI